MGSSAKDFEVSRRLHLLSRSSRYADVAREACGLGADLEAGCQRLTRSALAVMTIATRHTMDCNGARLLRVERRRAVAPSRLLQH
jgi:hypothetical protein